MDAGGGVVVAELLRFWDGLRNDRAGHGTSQVTWSVDGVRSYTTGGSNTGCNRSSGEGRSPPSLFISGGALEYGVDLLWCIVASH